MTATTTAFVGNLPVRPADAWEVLAAQEHLCRVKERPTNDWQHWGAVINLREAVAKAAARGR